MTPSWQHHHSNTDAEIHRLYARRGLSLMRIAKMFDLRVREVREALARQRARMAARLAKGHATRYAKPVTLARLTLVESSHEA